jgi:hypothetical protein
MCFIEIASWPLSWLIRVWRAVAVPDIASAQAMEQQQRPDNGVVFMTVFVSVLSGIVYVEVYVSWYVQCAKLDSCFVTRESRLREPAAKCSAIRSSLVEPGH